MSTSIVSACDSTLQLTDPLSPVRVQSSDTPTTQKSQKWHDYHNDPEAKLILQSSDGVLFRASGWRLSKARYVPRVVLSKHGSPVFKSMLELPNATEECQAANKIPIHVDTKSRYLCIFLDLTSISAPFIYKSMDARTTHEVLHICDKFECQNIARLLRQHLHRHAESSPWVIFKFAAKINDIDLGRCALQNMARRPEDNPFRDANISLWTALHDLRATWQIGLLKCMLRAPHEDDVKGAVNLPKNLMAITADWKLIAAKFKPEEQEVVKRAELPK